MLSPFGYYVPSLFLGTALSVDCQLSTRQFRENFRDLIHGVFPENQPMVFLGQLEQGQNLFKTGTSRVITDHLNGPQTRNLDELWNQTRLF